MDTATSGNVTWILGAQVLATLVAIVWSFGLTLANMKVLAATVGVRVDVEAEATGLDLALHRETTYHSGGLF